MSDDKVMFYVPGKPIPQGSKKWLPNHRMVEANRDLRPWRATVTSYTQQAMSANRSGLTFPLDTPLMVVMSFSFTRPKAHYGTGKNAGKVKDNAPHYVTTTPDLDKLVRGVNDGITDAGLWVDDSYAVLMQVSKHYAEQAGVTVIVSPIS